MWYQITTWYLFVKEHNFIIFIIILVLKLILIVIIILIIILSLILIFLKFLKKHRNERRNSIRVVPFETLCNEIKEEDFFFY